MCVQTCNGPPVRWWDGAIPQTSTSFGPVFFRRRRRSGSDRFLPVKRATLIVGGVLGLVGMRVHSSLLVSAAIGVVLVGFLLRFVPQHDSEADAKGQDLQAP